MFPLSICWINSGEVKANNTPEPLILARASPSQLFATMDNRSILALITSLEKSLSGSDSERWDAIAWFVKLESNES
jgi:hypothetical protein